MHKKIIITRINNKLTHDKKLEKVKWDWKYFCSEIINIIQIQLIKSCFMIRTKSKTFCPQGILSAKWKGSSDSEVHKCQPVL